MKSIELTRGKVAFVDDDDYEWLINHKWYANIGSNTKTNFYAATMVFDEATKRRQRQVRMHRLIMGAGKNDEVDHINHNTLDNRKCNLRLVSHAENMRNKALQINNKTGVPGVSFNKSKNKWSAGIGTNGKFKEIGTFKSFGDAVAARKKAEIENNCHPLHGINLQVALD